MPRPRCESSEENVKDNSQLRHPSGDLCNNSADLVDNRVNYNVFASENSSFVQHNTATLHERTASVTSPILKSGSGTLSSSDRRSVALNTKDQEQDSGRDRGMSVSSIASRDSLASVSSFSSSFMIDRIFHWRKSGTKSMKSPDSDTSRNFRLSSAPQHSRISLPNSNSNNNVQYQQIDKLAAESLATFNLVTEDDSDDTKAVGSHSMLPDKPIRFQIKQLEQLLCGQLCPPAGRCGDCFSLQLRLDSLRVMRSLEGAGLTSPPTDLVYDVPR